MPDLSLIKQAEQARCSDADSISRPHLQPGPGGHGARVSLLQREGAASGAGPPPPFASSTGLRLISVFSGWPGRSGLSGRCGEIVASAAQGCDNSAEQWRPVVSNISPGSPAVYGYHAA